MADFELKRGDTAPSLVVVLRDRLNQPVDLSIADNVQLVMRTTGAASNSAPRVSGEMTVAADQTLNRGQVTYDWQAGDTDAAGVYSAEFIVTWGVGGREQTFPTSGYVTVQINDDLESHVAMLAAARMSTAAHAARTPRSVASTAAEAEAIIRRKVAADAAPALTNDEIDALVTLALRPDGTYATNRAAAEGWRWKAAKVAGGFSFSADGVMVDKTMLMKHCADMVKLYTSGSVRSIAVDTGLAPFERPWYV